MSFLVSLPTPPTATLAQALITRKPELGKRKAVGSRHPGPPLLVWRGLARKEPEGAL